MTSRLAWRSPGGMLMVCQVVTARPPLTPPPAPVPAEPPRPQRPLDESEKQHRAELVELLRRHGGNISAVARELGKARMQVQRWIARYAIEVEQLRGPGGGDE